MQLQFLKREVNLCSASLSQLVARSKLIHEELQRDEARISELKRLIEIDNSLTSIFEDLRQDTLSSFLESLSLTASNAVEDVFCSGYSVSFSEIGTSGGYRILLKSPSGHEDSLDTQGDGIKGIVSIAMLLSIAHLSERFPSEFICMDEPLPGVDSRRESFYRWLSEVCATLDIQLIFTTHQPEAMNSSDTVIDLSSPQYQPYPRFRDE